MASGVLFERQPLDRTVLCRTVANVLSIGLVVRRCLQSSAGKSQKASSCLTVLRQAHSTAYWVLNIPVDGDQRVVRVEWPPARHLRISFRVLGVYFILVSASNTTQPCAATILDAPTPIRLQRA